MFTRPIQPMFSSSIRSSHTYLRILAIGLLMPFASMQASSRIPRVEASIGLNIKDSKKTEFLTLKISEFMKIIRNVEIDQTGGGKFDLKAQPGDPDIHLLLKPGKKDERYFDIVGMDKDPHITIEVVEGIPVDKLGYKEGMTADEVKDKWKKGGMKEYVFVPLEIEYIKEKKKDNKQRSLYYTYIDEDGTTHSDFASLYKVTREDKYKNKYRIDYIETSRNLIDVTREEYFRPPGQKKGRGRRTWPSGSSDEMISTKFKVNLDGNDKTDQPELWKMVIRGKFMKKEDVADDDDIEPSRGGVPTVLIFAIPIIILGVAVIFFTRNKKGDDKKKEAATASSTKTTLSK